MAVEAQKKTINNETKIAFLKLYQEEWMHRDKIFWEHAFKLFYASLIVILFPNLTKEFNLQLGWVPAELFPTVGMIIAFFFLCLFLADAKRSKAAYESYQKIMDTFPERFRRIKISELDNYSGSTKTAGDINAVKSLTVKIDWEDEDNHNDKRPDSVTAILSNGKDVVLKKNDWSATINDLPVYENDEEIVYTWTEETPTGYSLSIKTNGDTTTLTNTNHPKQQADKDEPHENRSSIVICSFMFAGLILLGFVELFCIVHGK